jgi:hypothetical protein
MGIATVGTAQTKPPAGSSPQATGGAPAVGQGLKDGWEQIDQRMVFLTVELSNIESEITATNKALKANGYKLAESNAAAEHARAGNEIMDRNGGGPVPWKEFYGRTAAAFFYHPTDDATVHINPLPLDQRPPQFDYIYRANLEHQAKAEDDAEKIGNKIDDLLSHRRDLETQQSALWCKIAFRAIASKELASYAMYRFDPTVADTSETAKQQSAAIKAGTVFMRAIDTALGTAQSAVDTDQAGAIDALKQSTLAARGELQDSLLRLPKIAVELDNPLTPIGKFSRGAKRLADSAENMVDAIRMATAAEGENQQNLRSTTRGQLQQMVFDYTSTVITTDQSLATAAKNWNITPDLNKPLAGSVPAPVDGGKTGDTIPGRLDTAKAAYMADISNARRALVSAVDARYNAAADAGDLATVESLQAAKASAARDGTVGDEVKDPAIITAKAKMVDAITAANNRMATAYREAIRDYTRARQITEAHAVQDEFNASGLSGSTAAANPTAGPASGEGSASVGGTAAVTPVAPAPDLPGTGSTFTPPNLTDDITTIDLPAPVSETCIGGGGRYLILHLKKVSQLAVFDVSAAKVLKYLPLPTNDICFTAGQKKLFIGLKDLRQIQRWDLSKLTMELSVPAPTGGVGGLALGADAIGPLVAVGDKTKHLWQINPANLHAEPYPSKNWGTEGSAGGPDHCHMSFDGTTVAMCGGGWAGIELSDLSNGKVVSLEAGSYINGDLTLAGNGSLIFHVWDDGITRSDLAGGVSGIDGHPFPADDPALSLSLVKGKKKPELVIFSNSDPKPLVTLRDLPELAKDSKLALSDRIHLIPRGKVLITLGEGSNQLILRKFDLAEELNEEGTDYLFVNSAPVCFAERGKPYNYKMTVLSKKGGVKIALQSGPPGMTVNDGTIHWVVPSHFADDRVEVIVQVTDAAGQSAFHSFSISVADRMGLR